MELIAPNSESLMQLVKCEQPRQDLLASGAGRIVHITRNPTQLVMSGYVYHRKAAEALGTRGP